LSSPKTTTLILSPGWSFAGELAAATAACCSASLSVLPAQPESRKATASIALQRRILTIHPDLAHPPARYASTCVTKQDASSAHTSIDSIRAVDFGLRFWDCGNRMAWGIGVAMPSGFRCGKRFCLYLNHPHVGMTFMPTRHPIRAENGGRAPQPRVPRVP
jgi:hypothetical protein